MEGTWKKKIISTERNYSLAVAGLGDKRVFVNRNVRKIAGAPCPNVGRVAGEGEVALAECDQEVTKEVHRDPV